MTDLLTHVAQMGGAERDGAARRAEAIANILAALRTIPDPARRLDVARHMAATQPAMGIDPRRITPSDVSDAGLSAHIQTALEMKAHIEAMAQRAAPGRQVAAPELSRAAAEPAALSPTGRSSRAVAGRPLAHPPEVFAPTGAGHLTDAELRAEFGGLR